MQRPRMLWADIGMAAAVGIFIAIIVLFHGESTFVTAISAYVAALIVWTFFCEWAVMRADMKQGAVAKRSTSNVHNSPLPH